MFGAHCHGGLSSWKENDNSKTHMHVVSSNLGGTGSTVTVQGVGDIMSCADKCLGRARIRSGSGCNGTRDVGVYNA